MHKRKNCCAERSAGRFQKTMAPTRNRPILRKNHSTDGTSVSGDAGPSTPRRHAPRAGRGRGERQGSPPPTGTARGGRGAEGVGGVDRPRAKGGVSREPGVFVHRQLSIYPPRRGGSTSQARLRNEL